MKSFILILVIFIMGLNPLMAQDSINVTFRFIASDNALRAFLPGEFNGWGPNNGGILATNAPSLMESDGDFWFKTVRLKIGGGTATVGDIKGYQYKMHEQYNSDGSVYAWFSDPLNDITFSNDNNSVVEVAHPMIFQIGFNTNNILDITTTPPLYATVAALDSDSIDVDASTLALNGVLLGSFGDYYQKDRQLLWVPSIADYDAELTIGENVITITAVTHNMDSAKVDFEFEYIAVPEVVKEAVPNGIQPGINYYDNDPTKVTLALFAPQKRNVFVLGDFNNWQPRESYFMKLDSVSADSMMWWIDITGLTPGQEYAFQYLVDGEIRVADPFAEKLLNSNDSDIPVTTYPNLKPYPAEAAPYAAGVIQTGQQPYQWEVTNFEKPKVEDLVIYELLIRDFLVARNYQTLIDTLDYLENLGINAIELMPINEFDGNESWGYNPAFFFANDKYYGPKNELKRFIDECHKRGIAVILDVVYNHTTGQSPFVRLYASGEYGPPAADNYWLNIEAPHPFSVFYDFNHESIHTKYLVDRANKFWLKEYNVDGFRYDLSKGFMQTGSWDGYNAGRISLLKRMYDKIREYDEEAILILEHLSPTRDEESNLASHGFLLWGNHNYNYNEATMGYNESGKSNFIDMSYKNWGMTVPHRIGYMESHDEERLMYKNIQFGESISNYNIKNLNTAINRIKLAASFFFTIPGPKMIWQFGELGYDYSKYYDIKTGTVIEGDDLVKVSPKPVRWDYFEDPHRKTLYKVFSELIKLKKNEDVFETDNFTLNVDGDFKRMVLRGDDGQNVMIVGNFDASAKSGAAAFTSTGWWYNHFEGDSLEVTDTGMNFNLAPGEWRMYTSKRLTPPEEGIVVNVPSEDKPQIPLELTLYQNYPNPFNPSTTISFNMPKADEIQLVIYDLLGRKVNTLFSGTATAGLNSFSWKGTDDAGQPVASGLYLYRLETNGKVLTKKLLLMK